MLNVECEPIPDFTSEIGDGLREKCGIVGIYSPYGGAVQDAYLAIDALQHRGQDGVGISYIEGDLKFAPRIEIKKALGRVAMAFGKKGEKLAHITEPEYATAHVRYETTEAEDPLEAQHPLLIEAAGKEYTIAQNGQFKMNILYELAEERGIEPIGTDTQLFGDILKHDIEGDGHIESAFHKLLPRLEGAFSLSILGPEGIYGVRDRHGMRPLVIGTRDNSVMLASEERALTAEDSDKVPQLDYKSEREVAPGTYVVINEYGIREQRWSEEDENGCVFELVYLSKPGNRINNVYVNDYRYNAGVMLAEMETVDADMVIPVLGSAKIYAEGYAAALGIEYEEEALQKDDTVGRSFIEKNQVAQAAAVKNKFKVVAELVEGKSVVVLDDSLVRGNTTRQIISLLKEAGANEVHVRIGSNIYSNPCAYGVNVQTAEELLAYGRTVEEMQEEIGADSLMFLPLEKMHKATGKSGNKFCDGCQQGGSYPQPRQPEPVPALAPA